MGEETDNKSLFSKKVNSIKSVEELKRKEEIKNILLNYPSITQITSISFKDTESHILEARPTVKCQYNIVIKDLVSEVIDKQWKLLGKSPRIVVLIMSNVGSVNNWTNAKQIKSFQKGLMKAAENTHMWLITNGIDMGATTIIGNAIFDYIAEAKYRRATNSGKQLSTLNFIGVADPDKIKYLQTITAAKERDETRVEITNEGVTHGENKYGLNQDLSHYILVEDPTEDKNGINVFLDNLTKFLSSEGTRTSQDEYKDDIIPIENTAIPVVSLIIKGGYGCSQLVLKQIENGVPVVVFKGSGGLADLLAFVDIEIRDRSLTEWDDEFAQIHLKPELTNRIFNLFPHYRSDEKLNNELYDFRDRILDSVRKSRRADGCVLLTVIDMLDTYTCNLENLTQILLSALFKTQRKVTETTPPPQTSVKALEIRSKIKHNIIKTDLNLCVDWNCPDVAKKEVLTKDPTFPLNDEKSLFEQSLTRKNRCDFVDLFLSQKFRLRTFITPKRIKRIFRKIHSHEFFSTVCWEGILGRTQDMKQTDRFIDRGLNWLVEALTGNSTFFNETELNLYITGQFPDSERDAERKALEMIVLWAILDFRKKLIRILWRNSDRPIYLALIIAMSYDRLSWYVKEQSLNDELKAESKQFVAFALSVLDKCYKESALRSENVLNEAPKHWNCKTSVDLAAFGRFREFFSHPSCQRWLTNKFYGNIAVKDNRCKWCNLPTLAKILMSAYLVFPIYWWIRLTNNPKLEDEEEIEEEDDDEQQQKKKLSKEVTTKSSTDVQNADKTVPKSDINDDKVLDNTTPGSSDESKQQEKLEEEHPKKPDLIKAPVVHSEVIDTKKSPVRFKPSIWTLVYEVWTAPITKFWNFQFFYTFYLSIFCIALLYPRCGNRYLDAIIAVWTLLLVIDDIRQTYILYNTNANVSMTFRLGEIVFKFTFVVVFSVTRLMQNMDDHRNDEKMKKVFLGPYHMKILMSLALLQAFLTLLSKFLPISATLGPLLYRLKIMLLVDFLNFIRLSILVMISFGVVIQAIMYPDADLDLEIFRKTFHRAFFSLFISPYISDLEVNTTCHTYSADTNKTPLCSASIYDDVSCNVTGFWPYIYVITYFILLKLILMTLLFALFASSASTLTADTDAIWKYQRYGLVLDFASRGPLPPPINIFYYIYIIFKWIYDLRYQSFKPNFKFKDFALLILYSKAKPQTRHLTDDEYNYFKLLASESYDEVHNQKDAQTLSSLQWERIQALSEESEIQRQILRQLRGKMSEMNRTLKNKSH